MAETTEEKDDCLTRFSRKTSYYMELGFVKWGRVVQRFPILVIIACVIILFGLLYGFMNRQEPNDLSLAWVPEGSRAREDKDTIEDVFDGLVSQ